MLRKQLLIVGLTMSMAFTPAFPAFAAEATTTTTTMENCGAYLFEWRPIDCEMVIILLSLLAVIPFRKAMLS